MTAFDPTHADHRDCWESIPWYVNGHLDPVGRQRLEAHLRACADCRGELALQRRVCEAMAAAADAGV